MSVLTEIRPVARQAQKSILVLSYASGLNGTAVHQNSFRRLFELLPEYRFTVLERSSQLRGQNYDVYLNLTPPYNVSIEGEGESDFYYFTTDWLKRSVWSPVKKAYRFLPSAWRRRMAFVKQRVFENFIGVLPPAENWVTLCHDLSPLVCREWFDFPGHWKVDFLQNFKKARHVIAVSESTRRGLIDHGVDSRKISVVYNSVDETFSRERPGVRPPVKDYFLVVGSFEPRKNHAAVYEAFRRIRDRISSKLVFIGGDKWGCQELYGQIRQDPGCVVLEEVCKEELVGWYQAARALVYPSWYEGFGLPVLEAAGCGIPVICSGTSGLIESGDGYAEFVRPDRPEEIAAKMAEVASPGYRIREDARAALLEKFSLRRNAHRLRRVLDGLLR